MTVTWWAVVLGAAVGAPCRWLLDGAVRSRVGVPWGILTVNLLGSLAAGLLAGLTLGSGGRASGDLVRSLVAVGFLGTFTTASTLAWDTLALHADGRRREAALDVVLSVGFGLALAGLGLAVGRAL